MFAIGGAKSHEPVGAGHLRRLERVRDLLARSGQAGASTARLLLFAGAGFSDQLTDLPRDEPDIARIGLDDLYGLDDHGD